MNEIDEIIQAYGYSPIESKNPTMRSYINETSTRVNHYFSSGTVQIQTVVITPTFPRGGRILKNTTTEELEEYL